MPLMAGMPGLFWVSGGDERCVRGRSAHHGELALPQELGRTRGEARGLSLTGVPCEREILTPTGGEDGWARQGSAIGGAHQVQIC